jgi:hypothetical protein
MPVTSKIREHMEVLGSDDIHVGTVDHLVAGDRIKLTRADSEDGIHHYLPAELVDHVDEHVHLSVPSDEAMEQMVEGAGDGELELEDEDEEAEED